MKTLKVSSPDTSAPVENPQGLDRPMAPGNPVLFQLVSAELAPKHGFRPKPAGATAASPTPVPAGQRAPNSFPPAGANLVGAPPVGVCPHGNGRRVTVAAAERIRRLVNGNGQFRAALISQDSAMLLSCDARGVAAEPLCYAKVALASPEKLDQGVVEASGEPELYQRFLGSGPPRRRFLPLAELSHLVPQPLPNLGWVLQLGPHRPLLRADGESHRACQLRSAQYWDSRREDFQPRTILGFTPADPRQVLAVESLLDPHLPEVAALDLLLGQPTHVRVRGNLQAQLYENGLVLLRAVEPSSHCAMGYLPGNHDAKLSPWLEPFFPALRAVFLVHGRNVVSDLTAAGRFTLLSTSLVRGLDMENSLVLVHERQKADRHVAKTPMSRFCASTKVALAGCPDPLPIDNPSVDWKSNALTGIKETHKGFGPSVAQVPLTGNDRGPISPRADAL